MTNKESIAEVASTIDCNTPLAVIAFEALQNGYNITREKGLWRLSQGHLPGITFSNEVDLIESYIKKRHLYSETRKT